jgi:DUF2993 family protein
MWHGRGRTTRVVAVLGAALLGALVLAQLLLPKIAADRIRSRIGRYGGVRSVSVSAWPAVKLLWGDADSVRMRAGNLVVDPGRAASLLEEGHGISHLDFNADSVTVGPLRLTDASFHKRGASMQAAALASRAAVQAALPPGLQVELVRSGGGEVEVRATGGLFGLQASVRAVAQANDGRLVVHPAGELFAGLQLTIFSDPHVYVEGIGASAEDAGQSSYRLSMSATLH